LFEAFAVWSKPTCAEILVDYRGVTYDPAAPNDGTHAEREAARSHDDDLAHRFEVSREA
jgi:hypothetical protein